MPEDMQLVKTLTDRETFLEDLFRYKFYCASNFYEDNIGSVEVVTLEGVGGDKKAEIRFDVGGLKKLLLKLFCHW